MQYLNAIICASVLLALASKVCRAANSNEHIVDCSQYQQSLSVDGVQLQFTSILDGGVGPDGYLHGEIAFPGQGWLGFGWSADGSMVPGYAIIGLPGVANSLTNPGVYNMAGEAVGAGGVYPLDGSLQTLTNASVTQNATHTSMTFTKRLVENGELTINGAGSNHFLVAYGQSNTLAYHAYRNTFSFALQSCINGSMSNGLSTSVIVGSGTSMQKQLWTAHGVFAAVAWGVLAPVAISASILRRIFIASDLPALWFKIHMTVNITVFIFTTLSFAFAVRAISLQQEQHFRGVKHRTTGLVIMILVFFQVINGLLRPHLPHPKEPEEDSLEVDGEAAEPAKESSIPQKSLLRISWELIHRLLGFVLVGFAWWQVGNGLGLYSQYFMEKDLANVFWGITGALSAITLVVYFFLFMDCV